MPSGNARYFIFETEMAFGYIANIMKCLRVENGILASILFINVYMLANALKAEMRLERDLS